MSAQPERITVVRPRIILIHIFGNTRTILVLGVAAC